LWMHPYRITPLFFPNWISGEATQGERAISLGLDAPGVAREYGVFPEHAVCRAAPHLGAAEAACYPCAGLTAWTSLVDKSNLGPGASGRFFHETDEQREQRLNALRNADEGAGASLLTPSVSRVAGGYTGNGSYFVGGGHMGFWK
jgi:hypothetical protein